MKKSVIIFSLLIISICLFSNTIVYDFKAYYFNDEWVNEKILKDLSFSFVKNDKVFMARGNDLLIGKNGNITLNFEKTFYNAYKVENNELFINVSFLVQYFNLNEFTLEDGRKIYYDKLPELIRVEHQNDTINFYFTSEISKDFINIQIMDNDLIITLSPLKGMPMLIGKIDYEINNDGFIFYILSNKLKPVPILTIQNKVATLKIKYTEVETKKIRDGIIWERKVETYNGQKFLVNYLHVDPKKAEISPIISSKGIGTREDLREMIKNSRCIAGINANYFDPSTNIPIDLVIKDGKLLSDKFGLRPVFIITYDNEVFIKRILVELNVYINDLLFLVKGVNTNAKGEVLLYTEEYKLPIPYDSEKNYFLIQEGRIVDTEYYKYVPDASMILTISKKYDKYLTDVDVGTNVKFVLNTDFPFPIKHAIGAGPLLLQNGNLLPDPSTEKVSYGNGIAFSKTNRTIIAITKDNKVDFIIIEGYNNGPGMNYDMAADFLLKKGYFSAMMLDGGGSSAMVINEKVVNQDGEIQRGIPVGIGIK
ncbi:phosphodiester glycosidase family protein [Thermosipho atlanticus]|uniref:Phosphodiester glycosidase domain-containing protein n=1 Tax=Thermosipho atlanticus DSM 15807 TaxID=1123380 RepID=A0A1M5SLW2_9BACT|nr:phosphodiester glycosidase family protein [Thermosipho atlanticus]SHH39527.1 Predicted protein [Thermosipho atlanticus DSM 15807]